MTSEVDTVKPVIVLGAGGHAKVIIDALRLCGREIIGITDSEDTGESHFCGIEVLGDDGSLLEHSPEEVVLANGIGAMPGSELRRKLHQRMTDKGYEFAIVIHPSAVVAADVTIGNGVQLMAGTVIQPGVRIGSSTIINTGVTVDHDCNVHSHCHLAPGVTLSGNVEVNRCTHIGTGTSIIQGITIGENCVIAAGSIIYSDVADNTRHIQAREPFQVKE